MMRGTIKSERGIQKVNSQVQVSNNACNHRRNGEHSALRIIRFVTAAHLRFLNTTSHIITKKMEWMSNNCRDGDPY